MFIEIDEGDIRAFFRGSDRNGASDSAIAARDQDDSILEFLRAAPFRAVGPRLRPHLGLQAGLTILMLGRKSVAHGNECTQTRRRERLTVTAGDVILGSLVLRFREDLRSRADFDQIAHQKECGEIGDASRLLH